MSQPDAALHYFEKSIPEQPVSMPDGKRLMFPEPTIEVDGRKRRIFKTNNPVLVDALKKHVAAKRCGVMEIDERRYNEIASKKVQPPSPGATLKKNGRYSSGSQPEFHLGSHKPPTARQQQAAAPAQQGPPPAAPRAKQPGKQGGHQGIPPTAVIRGNWKVKTGNPV